MRKCIAGIKVFSRAALIPCEFNIVWIELIPLFSECQKSKHQGHLECIQYFYCLKKSSVALYSDRRFCMTIDRSSLANHTLACRSQTCRRLAGEEGLLRKLRRSILLYINLLLQLPRIG